MVHQLAHQRHHQDPLQGQRQSQVQYRAGHYKPGKPTGLIVSPTPLPTHLSTHPQTHRQKPAKKPEQLLIDWLCQKSERTATPCIAYLFKKGFYPNRAKQCFERMPLRRKAGVEEIASEIARRMVKMKETQRVRSPFTQEFVAVAVQMEGAIACWSGEKWVKSRCFNGKKNTLKNHPGRLALLMLMNAI